MTQDVRWIAKYDAVISFIKLNKRTPSRYNPQERGLYGNWLRHNKKLYNAGEMKPERVGRFRELLELCERYRRKNQYE